MGLFVINNPDFGYLAGNALTTRPAAAMGTAITPGANNVYGSYTQLLAGASVARDCYGVLLNFNSGASSTQSRNTIVTIGIDSAGGTAYVDTILHLLASGASSFLSLHGGHWYYFPLFIKSGSSIAAKASVNHATASTVNCTVRLYGAPKNISGLVYGHGVETLGIVTATSSGTAVTSGEASEGAWTSLGSSAKRWKFAQMGFGIDDVSLAVRTYSLDLSYGDGTNQVILDEGKLCNNSAAEEISSQLRHSYCDIPAGIGVYGRMQCSAGADSNLSMAAYGVY